MCLSGTDGRGVIWMCDCLNIGRTLAVYNHIQNQDTAPKAVFTLFLTCSIGPNLHSPKIPVWRYVVSNIINVEVCSFDVVAGRPREAAIAASRAKTHAVCDIWFAHATLEMTFSTSPHPEFARHVLATLQHACYIIRLDFKYSAAVTPLRQTNIA